MEKEKNFFDAFGLEIAYGEVEVGNVYPFYGAITKIIDDTPGAVIVELNHSIRVNLFVPTQEKVELLKQRAFEPGIFVSEVVSKDPVEVDCSTVIFGKRQSGVQ